VVSHPSKCQHSVYWPASDEVNLGCQQCNPNGLGAGEAPVLPRSSSDTLGRSDARENCECGNLRTYFTNNCRHCGKSFPEAELRGQSNLTANRRQTGACPECCSTIHYETNKKGTWECSDCGTKFKAPKGVFDAAE
jgi:hypothetical protein